MKVSEMIKKLKKIGCFKVEEGKEHEKWFSPLTGKFFMVPRHRSQDLKTGTANSIAKDAGLY